MNSSLVDSLLSGIFALSAGRPAAAAKAEAAAAAEVAAHAAAAEAAGVPLKSFVNGFISLDAFRRAQEEQHPEKFHRYCAVWMDPAEMHTESRRCGTSMI